MKLGPDKVIVCPECKAPARVFSLISGNTLGIRHWTDGKMEAPMLPVPPAITRCRVCENFFWVDQAEVVGELHPRAQSILERTQTQPETLTEWEKKQLLELEKEGKSRLKAWLVAEQVRKLSEIEYLRALIQGLAADRKQEIHLRVGAWWASNDPLRNIPPEAYSTFERPAESIENLKRLNQLLSPESVQDRIMKAEIAREQGYFNQALDLLNKEVAPKYQDIVSLIRSLARSKDLLVRKVS